MRNAHGVESIMTMGVLAKILFNHIRPTYMAYSSNYYTNVLLPALGLSSAWVILLILALHVLLAMLVLLALPAFLLAII